ncbi:hypothetical protein BN1723_009768 [Verticillium longisporum]|uniref:Uncharacterized protein n=1 Tax=Verticillium longisporum TaxID=100787 RepID=A0A0G4M2C5_VERLO|nr:hypothetical protein BN1723_009768 [Verticillium longisporum]CRK27990.1 hypothetical protein BN1708_015049 [Verticillium longisporum]
MVLFETQALDTDKSNDDFFSDAKTGVQPVVGSGQMIYWQACTVKVFGTGKEVGQPVERVPQCDGQVLARKGVSLIFEIGRMKEV